MRIVFWGSSDFSLPSLELLRHEFNVVGVVTNPDRPVGRGMKEMSITPMKFCSLENNLHCMQPEGMNDPLFWQELEQVHADLFVVVSFGKIIPEHLIYMPRYNTINLHASLLPRYRGASPIHQALINGDKETGNTVQFITKELDKGDILAQSRMAIQPDELFPSLHDRLAQDGARLLMEAIRLIAEDAYQRVPQNNADASYCRIIKKNDGIVDFRRQTAQEIYNRYRAFYHWPGISASYACGQTCDASSQKEIPISFTKIQVNDKINGDPGVILVADKTGLTVACRDKAVDILRLKPAGKKEMDYPGFINGYHPVVGTTFSPGE